MLSWRWASSKVFGRVGAQVGAFGEVVAQKAVHVLVGAALPGRVRVGEVDIDRCLLRQLFGFGYLGSLIPGQRAPQILG